ncbi:MAG: alpha-1-antitrypsin [Crocinitomicaceae bacterium]|nr:alpha-1-antitrypsin [Crocinitomicaceae bacterium]|tara:strand:- start:1114 stop:1434 length:321 start_codon:yes stop_codon:yes gene_type:complete
MRYLNILAVAVLSLSLFACEPLGEHCPDENEFSQCQVKPDKGPCEASITKYYYDEASGSCKEFEWGGCQGSVPFHSLSECQECAGSGSSTPVDNPNTGVVGNGLFN